MRLHRLTLLAVITGCAAVKPYAALTWDTLDEAYTRQIEAQPAIVSALVEAGRADEARARIDQVKTSIARWNIISLTIEAALRGWGSGDEPTDLYALLQEARQILKQLPVAIRMNP